MPPLHQISKVQCQLWQDNLPENDNENDHTCDKCGDDHDKAEDLFLEGCHASFGVRCELCDTPKDSAISGCDADTQAATRDAMRSLHTDIVCLEIVIFGAFYGCVDGFGFT